MGMLTEEACLLQNNARPHHVARVVAELLNKFGRDVLTQPPYGVDLAPSDCFYTRVSGKRFDGDGEVNVEVDDWLKENTGGNLL